MQSPTALLQQAFEINNRAVVFDVRSECAVVDIGGVPWYDTRPALSEHEHCREAIDMMRQALDYGVEVGLLARHTGWPHLVRVQV